MRKLSYSTSPRLTALELCAPVDKHDRNNSEKKKKKQLSLTPGRVSTWCSTVPTDVSRYAISHWMNRTSLCGVFTFLWKVREFRRAMTFRERSPCGQSTSIPTISRRPRGTTDDPFDSAGSKLENHWCPEPIGTNTDLTHSPRYKPFSTLMLGILLCEDTCVWNPQRAHTKKSERPRGGTTIIQI